MNKVRFLGRRYRRGRHVGGEDRGDQWDEGLTSHRLRGHGRYRWYYHDDIRAVPPSGSAPKVTRWRESIILWYPCTIKRCIQSALPLYLLAQNLYSFLLKSKGSYRPGQTKGQAMQLSSRTKTALQSSHVHWMETLSASVTSFLAGVWCTPQPALV